MAGFNFFDILIIIIIFRSFFAAKNIGILPGLFFLLGVISANFLAIHYYPIVGKPIWGWLAIPAGYGDFIAFIFLTGVIIAVFSFVSKGWQTIIKLESNCSCTLWSGIITTFLSYILICGMLFLSVFISRNDYLMFKARNCFTYKFLGKVSVRVYEGLFGLIVRPLFPTEKINDQVFKAYSREKGTK